MPALLRARELVLLDRIAVDAAYYYRRSGVLCPWTSSWYIGLHALSVCHDREPCKNR